MPTRFSRAEALDRATDRFLSKLDPDQRSTKEAQHQGFRMLFFSLPLSAPALRMLAGVIRGHRAAIGSRWRRLSLAQEALMVLVVVKKDEPFAQVGAGFGVSATTCWRRVGQVVALWAARAPA